MRKILPSYERLNEAFNYNETTGIIIWKISTNNFIKIGSVAGTSNEYGHIIIKIDGELYLAHRIIWKMMLNEEPPDEIDHENTIPNDNRWLNLRESLHDDNLANSKLSKANTSGYKGVCYNKRMFAWQATIGINYKTIVIGYYNTKEKAALARKNYALKVRGEFARETLA